jgi:hypothetical protein
MQSWIAGTPARTPINSLSTDGEELYSYKLCIGYKGHNGRPMVKDYRSPNNISQTTSTHVGLAIGAINDPAAIRNPYPPMVGVARNEAEG